MEMMLKGRNEKGDRKGKHNGARTEGRERKRGVKEECSGVPEKKEVRRQEEESAGRSLAPLPPSFVLDAASG